MTTPIEQHNIEIQKNKEAWERKPLLRSAYKEFYEEILKYIRTDLLGEVVEIGSGIGNFKSVYPAAISTDIFPNPWLDRVEDVYHLSSVDSSVSNLVIFDVFHHLEHPGSALSECKRVLTIGGRVVIFEPCLSLLGLLVYGLFHHEPLGLFSKIIWKGDDHKNYYAAQGNAMRIFGMFSSFKKEISADWNIVCRKKYSAFQYVLTGGFSKPSFHFQSFLSLMWKVEDILDLFPPLFATRMLIVLEKK